MDVIGAGERTCALPIVPVRARGLTVEGADGRRYLDCLSGGGALALGHNHPVVLAAIRKVLDSGAPLHAPGLATPVKDAFVTELLRTLPPGLAGHARVRFCGPAGTDAVAAALTLARTATGRAGVLAFSDAHHATAAGVSGGAPYPYGYRCPYGVGGQGGAELAARWAESVLDGAQPGVARPGCVILEPVQGEGGVVPVPDDWLRRVRQVTADRGVPLIADEIQTGVGRTGAFWAVEHSGITPDVMVLSQAIGGSLPLAVIVHRDDLVGEPGAHAFPGNQLAMAAGAATLAHVREHRLADHAAGLGARMLRQLRALAGEFPYVGEVRGRGLMIGVDMAAAESDVGVPWAAGVGGGACASSVGASDVAAVGGGAPAPHLDASGIAAAVQRACLERGLIVGRHGSVVRLLPPLTITDDQATAILDRFADAIGAVAGDPVAAVTRYPGARDLATVVTRAPAIHDPATRLSMPGEHRTYRRTDPPPPRATPPT
ncbi:aminotransferase class III-fold pyridoxal phosphate-dependent enzyme [Streptomyces acidiscabies]|uniref:Diaminobutyrate--2-oxoglutarate transaminase n=3 Tax=Streptomyces acidiscabies TaxID=42234 RepID=A0AAP6B8D0_9ACTN|nr:aminotransferase class III-fold pyridoxal phosphate-dependent enzyme [Streptomyces acidiscabies]MDX2960043.1 aminotransferase class III-fold pyridoxal phosphate-dependent enzyme [Streptomyces acidiscabies]MDX3019394.1 aminotransferase class III-fold pyridoxal phosphate-dependent enzyme [Streptomyces acidiscabies]MDX3793207.1 aminotransferase class III-fold pyridoxal phosphate-dependent enzyme [Streptomyces acidiscabies]